MAAIMDPERQIDLDKLNKDMNKALPSYAQPLFVRFISAMDLTGTYKLRKVDYQKEAFDLDKVKDEVFFLDPSKRSYVPFTKELHDDLKTGKIRI